MPNILDLKDLVFGARDIDNDLMIKQDSSYILRHHINNISDFYPHSLSALSDLFLSYFPISKFRIGILLLQPLKS